MTSTQFEKKMLDEINSTNKLLNEKSTLMTRLIGTLFKKKMDRILTKTIKKLSDDPDIKAAVIDYHQARDRAKDSLETYCKKRPDSAFCSKRGRKAFAATPW